jgi:hypothetical protein
MTIIEVYKTNVQNNIQVRQLVNALHRQFPWYTANFDLHDCDNILRVESSVIEIEDEGIIKFMKTCGFTAEPLPG